MSGGYFDYDQYRIDRIADDVKQILVNVAEGDAPDYQQYENVSTYESLVTGWKYLKIAAIFAQRIDYLISGDDSENSFHRRIKEDSLQYAREKREIIELLNTIKERFSNENESNN